MGAGTLSTRRLRFALALLFGLFCVALLKPANPVESAAGINEEMNFQGRLFTSEGATVPDGYYNIQFKIYQDGDGQSAGNPSGTLMWTESHLNNDGNGVRVKNGFLSVQLGSVTPFGTNIDWDQNTLWLSMNIAGTGASCTPFSNCSPDGEMTPMKRLSTSPYALNSKLLGGVSSSGFVQLAQGVQADSSNVSSIFINKTGTGNLLQLQNGGVDAFTLSNSGDVLFGNNADHSISVSTADADTAGNALTISAGDAGTGAAALAGGNLVVTAGDGGGTDGNGGNVLIDAGAANGSGTDGTIGIGTNAASTIQIGSTTNTGTQTINVGNNGTAGSTTNLTLGSSSTADAGSTTLQAKDDVQIGTNGTVRGIFDNNGFLYLGNGSTSSSPTGFTVIGTASNATGVNGGQLTLQGGNATSGNASGGNLALSGGDGIGTGAQGLVVLSTTSFTTSTSDPNCFTGGALVASSCTVSQDSLDNYSSIMIGFSQSGQTATLPDPTNTTAGRVVYITAANGSSEFSLEVNGGGAGNAIAMRANTSATMIWNGTEWTAAGASSSTTLQSAYDNTLQSAGGAELVVSKTSNTNGLTIRDSTVNPVNGTLLSVQTSSAAELFSVNSNVTEYATDGGAETILANPATFPANSWDSVGSATVTRYDTTGDYIATGRGSVSVATTTAANDGVSNMLNDSLTANVNYNVSFGIRLASGTFTDMNVYYSVDGSTASVECTSSQIVPTSVWAKIDCSFTTPTSGVTSSNAILIRQAGSGTARTFYVDNLSVTIAGDFNYATDGGVNDGTNFSTNWTSVSSATVSQNTTYGSEAGDSAEVITSGTSGQGIRNQLRINPLEDTLYRVSVYASSTASGFDNFTIRYSRDGGTSFVDCKDYNTQTISSSANSFTHITCYITTDSTTATDPYVYFTQTDTASRTFYVDEFNFTLYSNTAPNVQIGGGVNGGPVTLLTLDRAASAPIPGNIDALLGSMYYDTTLGKLQCYEADGWGACGSSPDVVVTISPEYTNAVLHGTGVGTMTSDICSDDLDINDGTSSQPTICGTNETYNFYKWTSPQANAQTYSIFVSYQLPSTFKSFLSGQTSVYGRTDSSNATVQYQIYRQDSSSGLTACGSSVSVSSGSVSSWQVGSATGASDPSTCSFTPGSSIVFKIDVVASQNANAYVGNLNFTYSNN